MKRTDFLCAAGRMTRTVGLTVTKVQAGRTVGSLLKNELRLSGARISRLKRRENGILLSGAPAYTTARVKEGDTLDADVSDPPDAYRPAPVAYPLSIVYEDDALLVLDKPAGLPVHASTRAPGCVTLENALAAYLPGDCGMHPVSRLDKGTTGLMTISKTGYVHELLRRIQGTDDFIKTYLALCAGAPVPASGVIDAPLGYAPGSRYKMAVIDEGARAVTAYETLWAQGGLSLVACTPRTGRTHQIRVHMAHIGCPLIGDWLYGAEDTRISRPALHAAALTLVHPLTGETLRLHAPLPPDMAALCPPDVEKKLFITPGSVYNT